MRGGGASGDTARLEHEDAASRDPRRIEEREREPRRLARTGRRDEDRRASLGQGGEHRGKHGVDREGSGAVERRHAGGRGRTQGTRETRAAYLSYALSSNLPPVMTDPTLPDQSSTATRDRIFWSLIAIVVLTDIFSKRWAERVLGLHVPVDVFDPWLRWTLTYNTGAAMNLSLGAASRYVFSAIALGMIIYLFRLYRQSAPTARAAPAALALIAAGAFGNLLDRLRHGKGVVDFIDVGTAEWRFWTFNVADMGVTTGAILLALLLWREGDDPEKIPEAVPSSPGSSHDAAS